MVVDLRVFCLLHAVRGLSFDCRWCGQSFESRNQVFRHVRESKECLTAAVEEDKDAAFVLKLHDQHEEKIEVISYLPNERVGHKVQATGTSHRNRAFEQDAGCAAIADVIGRKKKFHAEKDCTERIYGYTVPTKWLKGYSDDLIQSKSQHVARAMNANSTARKALRAFKLSLRTVQNCVNTESYTSWHNLADPPIQLSPSFKQLRHPIRRARIAQVYDECIIVELSAKHFVRGQIVRVLAAALALQRQTLDAEHIALLASPKAAVLNALQLPAQGMFFSRAKYRKQIPTTDDNTKEHIHRACFNAVHALDAVDLIDKSASDLIAQLSRVHKVSTQKESQSHHVEVPAEYTQVLDLLRDAVNSEARPSTSAARQRVLACGDSFTLVNPALKLKKQPLANKVFPELAQAVFDLESTVAPSGRKASASCAINLKAQFTPHIDSGTGEGQTTSLIVGLGNYRGGELVVEHDIMDIQYQPLSFNGWTQRHWTQPFSGERFSLVWFTAKKKTRSDQQRDAKKIASDYNLKYRPNSTDVQAIIEVLGPNKCYAPLCNFSGHVVLDCGAMIGTFARFVLDQGASGVIAYEPEPQNAHYFRQNVPEATLIEAAVVGTSQSGSSAAELALAPTRTEDKAKNTWRHTLRQYAPSSWQQQPSRMVQTVNFVKDVLTDDITVVKLDIEGAEFDIIDAVQDWRNVQYLVIEYSLTKRRSMQPFRDHLAKLDSLGFDLEFDFQDTALYQQSVWTAHTDTLLFCRRRAASF